MRESERIVLYIGGGTWKVGQRGQFDDDCDDELFGHHGLGMLLEHVEDRIGHEVSEPNREIFEWRKRTLCKQENKNKNK